MSTDFSAALRMPIVDASDDPGAAPYETTAYATMLAYPKVWLADIAEALRDAMAVKKDRKIGICGTVGAYGLIPRLAASFQEADRPGRVEAFPIGKHSSGTPWEPRRLRLAAHCLGMIETFLAETAPSKTYKPTHGGYPCAY